MDYTFAANALSLLSLCVFLYYMRLRIKHRGYIFSMFNINFFVYTMVLWGSSLFASLDVFWLALGFSDATDMLYFFYKSLFINQLGYIFLVLTLIKTEFKSYNKNKKNCVVNLTHYVSQSLNVNLIDFVFYLSVVSWYLLVFLYNGSLPLFTSSRAFYWGTKISPIYQTLNHIIFFGGMYYGMKMALNPRKPFNFIIAILTLAFTGSRGPFLGILLVTWLCILYFNNKRSNFNFLTLRLLLVGAVFIFIAVFFAQLRRGVSFNLNDLLHEIAFGNTFSDIRDGAMILYGFENILNQVFLEGKTYIAGLISFIPTSISDYRLLWSFGRVTTTLLFDWEAHGGLRGGWSMEAYINFGYSGVLIFSIFQGYILSLLEKIFYYQMLCSKHTFKPQDIFVLLLILQFLSSLICTSALMQFYTLLLFVGILFFLSLCLKHFKNVQQEAEKYMQSSIVP